MKAEITKNGVLIVTAETDLEKYALSVWSKESVIFQDPQGSTYTAPILAKIATLGEVNF